jgi:preprotein translocase subunit SecG
MGAAGIGGASGTLFGSRGPASFFLKLTSMLAIAFFATALLMGYWVAQEAKSVNQLHVSSTSTPLNPSSTQPFAPTQP